MNRIKVGVIVKIIAGNFFGKEDKVIKFNRKENSVHLEGCFREKFIKNKKNKSDKAEKRKIFIPINISNVKLKKNSIEKKEISR
jgi:ribosomal protein L24